MKNHTTVERAKSIYQVVAGVFDYNKSSDTVTPPGLAKHQVNSLPSVGGKILIPGAGIGSYIIPLLERGVDPSNIYAVELCPAYFRLGSNIFKRFGVNFVQADFLTWDPQMQFDVVIGNPPYQKSKYSDFYVCFVRKAAEFLREGGYFSMIMPAKGANPLSRAQKPLAECGWNQVELGVEKFFPNIATVIAHYQGVKGSTNDKITVVIGDETLEVSKGTVLPLGSQDKLAYSVVSKIFGGEAKMPFYRTKQEPDKNYVYVSRMIGSWKPDKTRGGAFCLKAFVNECPGNFDGGFLDCESEDQANQLVWLMTRSLVMSFAVNQCARAAFIPPLFWSLTPDLTRCKTDEDIFEVLGFTEEEKSYVKQWAVETYK